MSKDLQMSTYPKPEMEGKMQIHQFILYNWVEFPCVIHYQTIHFKIIYNPSWQIWLEKICQLY